jgi:hypothetical protein
MGASTRATDESWRSDPWRSDQVLAWTEQEGPGRGPAAPGRGAWLIVAGALAVVFAGILSSDTLCPEHQLWVLHIGGGALIAAGTALIGLIDGWAGAPLLAMLSALGGIGVGVIDAVHAPTRGRLVAIGFGLVFVGASWLVWHQQRQLRWDRRVQASLRPLAPAAQVLPSGHEANGDAAATAVEPLAMARSAGPATPPADGAAMSGPAPTSRHLRP